MGTNLVQQIHACSSRGSEWTLGACGWGNVMGEDTLWVVLACEEVQMFPSSHAHPAEARTSSLGRVKLLHRKHPAGRCRRSPCHSLSPRVTVTHFFFFHTRERGNKCETLSPTKRKGYRNVFWLISPPQPCASWLLSKS